jgi:ADP-ribose pyrophosphatase
LSNPSVKDALSHDFTEHRLDGGEVYSGHLLKIQRDTVRLPGGGQAPREYIRHPGAAAILAVNERDEIVMEWQYRYAPGRHYLEIPAGKMDAGESPLEAARRELKEETGFEAEEWSLLLEHDVAIAYSDERIHIYLAQGLTQSRHQRDEEEFLECFLLPIQEALAWLDEGRLTDSKTQAAILTYARLRGL